jgi:hypothetical protein
MPLPERAKPDTNVANVVNFHIGGHPYLIVSLVFTWKTNLCRVDFCPVFTIWQFAKGLVSHEVVTTLCK